VWAFRSWLARYLAKYCVDRKTFEQKKCAGKETHIFRLNAFFYLTLYSFQGQQKVTIAPESLRYACISELVSSTNCAHHEELILLLPSWTPHSRTVSHTHTHTHTHTHRILHLVLTLRFSITRHVSTVQQPSSRISIYINITPSNIHVDMYYSINNIRCYVVTQV